VGLSLYVGESRDLRLCVEAIVDAERLGLHGVWLPATLGLDSLTALTVAAGRTGRIRLGAGIAYALLRHPVALAQQALTIAATSGGRFELGIGTGHRAVMERALGVPWDDPAGRMLEYGRVVRALLDHGRATLDGSYYSVDTGLWIEPRPAVPLIVGTLGERICRAAGHFADAIMTWLAPATYVSSVILPAASAGAEAAGRPPPRVIAAVPATLSRDRRAVRAGLNAAFGMMARAPAYLAMLERAGLEQPADEAGWTDEPLDAVVAWGDAAALHARARELIAAGADEIVFWPFPAGDDPDRSLAATLAAMQQISATEGALR
jgi:F420-dependent oxidoreductase-like protein